MSKSMANMALALLWWIHAKQEGPVFFQIGYIIAGIIYMSGSIHHSILEFKELRRTR